MNELDTVQFDEDSSEGDELCEMRLMNLLPNLKVNNVQYASADILLEALINQLCRYVESDPAKQKRLFIVICDKLHELHLLGKSYKLEELQYLRERYMTILQKLILAAKCLVDIDIPNSRREDNTVPLDTRIQSLRSKLFDWSRYAHEFRELDFIARGGFGQVYKAHNILDDCDYAVKKICLKYHKIDSFVQSLREVQTLAKLNHPNIVAYKAAWLEPFDSRKHNNMIRAESKPRIQEIRNTKPNTRLHMIEEPKSDPKLTSNSFEIEFKDSTASDSEVEFANSEINKSDPSHNKSDPSHHKKRSKTSEHSHDVTGSDETSSSLHISRLDRINEDDSSVNISRLDRINEDDSSVNISRLERVNEDDIPRNGNFEEIVPRQTIRNKFTVGTHVSAVQNIHNLNYFFPKSKTMSMDWVTLYIQMQLCQLTLKEWLSCSAYENPSTCNDNPPSRYDNQVLYIFRQIVQGLEYIHSQGIVHHDIKPSNIFVSHDLKSVQVGDFGLACCLLPHSPHQGGYSVVSAPPRSEHPLGTRLYAAPEQLHGLCDPKSDVYSLGIVLFEMLINYSTDMEKSKEITKLKMGHMPPRISSQYPHYAKIISKLLDVNPKHRPSAGQILLYLDSSEERRRLGSEDERDVEVEELRLELRRKRDEIEALQRRIQQLEKS